MKKIILSIAMVGALAFTGCSDNEENASCKSCDDLASTGVTVEICDNGNGTYTVTGSVAGQELYSESGDIPDEGTIDDVDCSDFNDLDLDLDLDILK